MAVSQMVFDHALVLRSQAGDEAAMGELLDLVRPAVHRYARRFFPDPSRAEDLAQTALMKAFTRVGDVRAPEAFHAWLLRITRNECLNELARQRHAQIPLSTLEDQGATLEAPPGGDDDPEETLLRTQMQELVRRVAATLPPHYRRTLTMRALEDRSYEEISKALDIPVAVARLWYCRARKRFRTAFVEMLVARREVAPECQSMGVAIADLIEGSLSDRQRGEVQGHLLGCATCRQTEEELRNTAFRTPARALLLGLGLLRAPRLLRRAATHGAARLQHAAAPLAAAGAGSLALVAAGPVHPLALPAPAALQAPAHVATGPSTAAIRLDGDVLHAAPAALAVPAGGLPPFQSPTSPPTSGPTAAPALGLPALPSTSLLTGAAGLSLPPLTVQVPVLGTGVTVPGLPLVPPVPVPTLPSVSLPPLPAPTPTPATPTAPPQPQQVEPAGH